MTLYEKMISPEEDPYVLVEDDGSIIEHADDEGFVLTGEEDEERSLDDDDDEPFILVAETLDSIMEQQNNANERTRRSARTVLTVIAAYLYALIGLTTIGSFLHRSPPSPWKPSQQKSRTTVQFPSPSIFIPTIARDTTAPHQPFVGYPVVPPKTDYYYNTHDLHVPRRADYAIHHHDDQEQDNSPYMPSPSPPATRQMIEQVRFSASAYASPPKVEPITVEAVPFPSITGAWHNKPASSRSAGSSTALMMIPTRRFPTTATNHTVLTENEPVPSIAAPRGKPILLPRHHHPGALSIPTVMRIPFAPTFHIPHAAAAVRRRARNETTGVPATAPPKDPSLLSYEQVLVAFFPTSLGTRFHMWWQTLQEQVDFVPSVRIDCATIQDDDELNHLCETTIQEEHPSLYLLRDGQVVQQLPFYQPIEKVLVHLERALAQTTATAVRTTSTAPVTLRSTPLTDDSFPAFIETHRFSIVVFYHPTQHTSPYTASVWRTFHQHQGPGRATVNCQAYPTTCRNNPGTTFPRLQRYRYGRAVIVPEEEDYPESSTSGTSIPRPSQHVLASPM